MREGERNLTPGQSPHGTVALWSLWKSPGGGQGNVRGYAAGLHFCRNNSQRACWGVKGNRSYLSPDPAAGAGRPPGPLLVVQRVIQDGWAGGFPQGWAQCPSAKSLQNGNSGYCSHLWEKHQQDWASVLFLPSRLPPRLPPVPVSLHTIEIKQDERAAPAGTGTPAPALPAAGSLSPTTCPPAFLEVRG